MDKVRVVSRWNKSIRRKMEYMGNKLGKRREKEETEEKRGRGREDKQ